LTAMRYGVYALVAVVFGVVLVGLLPGQISDMASPAQRTLLQGAEASGSGTMTTGGSIPSRYNMSVQNDTVTKATAATGSVAVAGSSTDAPSIASAPEPTQLVASDPYADLPYYGMMAVGLVVALGIYFAARRLSG